MFDRDEHPNFARAVDLANRNGINLAISNPCIELWFILHFERRTAYLERQVAQHCAEELLGCSKVLTDSALIALAERYDRARERAIRLDEKHAGDGSPPASNPSSSVWRLIDLIRTPDKVAALEADGRLADRGCHQSSWCSDLARGTSG